MEIYIRCTEMCFKISGGSEENDLRVFFVNIIVELIVMSKLSWTKCREKEKDFSVITMFALCGYILEIIIASRCVLHYFLV